MHYIFLLRWWYSITYPLILKVEPFILIWSYDKTKISDKESLEKDKNLVSVWLYNPND